MVENTCLKLCNLLTKHLTEVDSAEKRIEKIFQNKDKYDAADEKDEADFIGLKIEQLIKRCYDDFKLIDRANRIVFWHEFNRQLQQLPRIYETEGIQSKMSLLKIICYFEFTQKPFSFIFEGTHKIDVLNNYELQLLKLIQKLQSKDGLTNFFNTQCETIRNKKRKVVFGISGASKAGKSSFANYLLGADVCPTGIIETTARLTKITYGPKKLVKLESVTGELLQPPWEIQIDDQLQEVMQKLIALKGRDRKGEMCRDIVTIQLDQKELENIELWDFPGFDENSLLNSIVEDILKEIDILFCLTTITEGIRETIANLLESCYKKHKHQAQVCFIVTKIDEVKKHLKAGETIDNTLDSVFRRVQDTFHMKLDDNWRSSPLFIPLCTHQKYDLEDFFFSREQFTQKLTKFFAQGTYSNIHWRLKYLIDTMNDLLDYVNLNRSFQRNERLSRILTAYHVDFQIEMKEKLKELFIRIHQVVINKISTTMQSENDDAIRQALDEEIKRELEANHKEIKRNILKCLHVFYTKLEENPALKAVIWSFGRHNLCANPYSTIIDQYKDSVDSLISSAKCYQTRRSLSSVDKFFFSGSSITLSCLDRISPGLISVINKWTSKMRISTKVGDFIMQKQQWKMLEHTAQENVESSVQTIFNGIITDISDHIHEILSKQLNNISENLRKKEETLCKQIDSSGVQSIIQFFKENNSEMAELYLNLLDKMHRFQYTWYGINSENALDDNNFPMSTEKLVDAGKIYPEEIVIKCIPLNDFTWQEIRYMNELEHRNILRYYGIRKRECLGNQYDIIIQQCDMNLAQYIDHICKTETVSDKLINDIFLQVIDGLGYLHKQDFIHHNVKPENIHVQFKKKQSPVFFLDVFSFIDRAPISVKCKTDFSAPEVLTNHSDNTFITAAVDIYALGVTIKEILKKSSVNKESRCVKFWNEMSERCCLSNPFQRPTCQNILERHNKTIWNDKFLENKN